MLLTTGLQREKAGRAGLALYTQVVFSLILEFLIWQTIPSFLSTLGTAIILGSALWATVSAHSSSNLTAVDSLLVTLRDRDNYQPFMLRRIHPSSQ